MDHGNHNDGKLGPFTSRASVVLLGFLAVGGYFLVTEHRAHVIPFLPWLLLLACPLMHLFMHGGHAGHRGSGDGGSGSVGRR